jgi:hypothetical protein
LEVGELHLLLRDLHSLVRVPGIQSSDDKISLYHASLGDFFFDQRRSKEFFIDSTSIPEQLCIQSVRAARYWATTYNKVGVLPRITPLYTFTYAIRHKSFILQPFCPTLIEHIDQIGFKYLLQPFLIQREHFVKSSSPWSLYFPDLDRWSSSNLPEVIA